MAKNFGVRWLDAAFEGDVVAKKNEFGVIIDSGPADWQIIQQDKNGEASISLSGRWSTMMVRKNVLVCVRLIREDGYEAVTSSLDWMPAKTAQRGKKGSWRVTLKRPHASCQRFGNTPTGYCTGQSPNDGRSNRS